MTKPKVKSFCVFATAQGFIGWCITTHKSLVSWENPEASTAPHLLGEFSWAPKIASPKILIKLGQVTSKPSEKKNWKRISILPNGSNGGVFPTLNPHLYKKKIADFHHLPPPPSKKKTTHVEKKMGHPPKNHSSCRPSATLPAEPRDLPGKV